MFDQTSMNHLRFLKGRWIGTAPDGSRFYEACDRPDPRTRRYVAASFDEEPDGSLVPLEDGQIPMT